MLTSWGQGRRCLRRRLATLSRLPRWRECRIMAEGVWSDGRGLRRRYARNVPRRHPFQDSVPHDQRVKQDRTKVSEERQEEEIGKDGMRPAQHRVEHRIV